MQLEGCEKKTEREGQGLKAPGGGRFEQSTGLGREGVGGVWNTTSSGFPR